MYVLMTYTFHVLFQTSHSQNAFAFFIFLAFMPCFHHVNYRLFCQINVWNALSPRSKCARVIPCLCAVLYNVYLHFNCVTKSLVFMPHVYVSITTVCLGYGGGGVMHAVIKHLSVLWYAIFVHHLQPGSLLTPISGGASPSQAVASSPSVLDSSAGMSPSQQGLPLGCPNSVLRIIIENMIYPITLDVLHQVNLWVVKSYDSPRYHIHCVIILSCIHIFRYFPSMAVFWELLLSLRIVSKFLFTCTYVHVYVHVTFHIHLYEFLCTSIY